MAFTAVIGCGNPILGDEGVGIHALNKLKKCKLPKNVKLIEAGVSSLDILEEMKGFKKAIIIDAVRSGGKAGSIYRLTEKDLKQGKYNFLSLHGLKLEHTLALGKVLFGQRFPKILIFGVEVKNVNFSTCLSEEVSKALPRLIELIKRELK